MCTLAQSSGLAMALNDMHPSSQVRSKFRVHDELTNQNFKRSGIDSNATWKAGYEMTKKPSEVSGFHFGSFHL